jgi:hypothetical protein
MGYRIGDYAIVVAANKNGRDGEANGNIVQIKHTYRSRHGEVSIGAKIMAGKGKGLEGGAHKCWWYSGGELNKMKKKHAKDLMLIKLLIE